MKPIDNVEKTLQFSFFLSLSPQALSYAGGFGKALLPHVVEKEIVQDDGSVIRRLEGSMGMCRNGSFSTE